MKACSGCMSMDYILIARDSATAHIQQMEGVALVRIYGRCHVLSPLDSTSILYRHVVCLRLCCACSFFPFETQTHCTNFASLVKEAGEFGHQPTAVSWQLLTKSTLPLVLRPTLGGTRCNDNVYVLVFSHGGSPKNLKNRSWVRDYMSMRGTLAVMKHNS